MPEHTPTAIEAERAFADGSPTMPALLLGLGIALSTQTATAARSLFHAVGW